MSVAPLYEPCDAEFERLYRRYGRHVYRYALAVLRNPADAEDVTQTTFLNAFRAMRAGTEPELPENWLLRIAHNTCRTRFLRAARRPREVPLDDSVRQLAVPEDEKPNLDEVLRALERLPFNQRSALVMRELEGRSYEEIAEALGVSVSSVEALLFRARRSLRVRRAALRVIGLVQLPPSLEALFGGSAATTGGAVAGGGALLKLATFIAAALTAGGAGYEAVQAYSARPSAAVAAPVQGQAGAPSARGNAGEAATLRARSGVATFTARARSARTVHTVGSPPAATVTGIPTSPGPAQPGTQPSTPSAPAPGSPWASAPSAPTAPAPAPPSVPVSAPTLPSTPQLPAPPVTPPALPPPPDLPPPPALPPPPPLPAVPTLPPPPPLPDPPKLP